MPGEKGRRTQLFGTVRGLADVITRHPPNPVVILFCRDCFDHAVFRIEDRGKPKNHVLSLGSSWEVFNKLRTH